MKQGWKIKKLGDVATYVNGYAFKPEHWVESGTPIIRIQNLNNPDAPYNYCNFDIPSKYIVERGDILISWSASLGVYEWGHDNGYLNQHIFKVVFDKGDINKYYLKYAVSTKISDMLENLHGATMKHIVKKDFDNTLIPVPPIAEQEKIVAELDCLSGIIEKKKQQLKELDNLAQSIFYEMFGDPVENDKGWEQKTIGSFSKCVAGATPSTKVKEYWDGGTIPWLSSGEVGNGRIYATEKHITQEGYDNASTKLIPPHTVVMALAGQGKTRGTVGVAEIPLCTNQSICSIITNDGVNVDFLYYQLRYLYHELRDISNGDGGRGGLNLKLIQGFKVLVPPFDLQQEFASKIQSIEKQKELIAKSIKETETLFNSRMDYYFN